ncbi:MAG: NAD-dependent deacetylase [Frankiales bacterium]|nr:NAD-dependent deacetylase [Frankiales bacterium]
MGVYDDLADLISAGSVVILTGAGISTESGIPDYRGETGRVRPASPMTYQEFVGSSTSRQRYWARSHVGWRFIADVRPNAGHLAVTELQRQELLTGIVTQNVDGLHQAAGAEDVLELHGGLDGVICLDCGERSRRTELETRLTEANPGWRRETLPLKPDGDVDLDDTSGFTVVDCVRCEGVLKPDVVFFGETVPRDRVARAFAMVDAATTLLVLGSSLTVMSGYRFVLHARKQGKVVAIVNQGLTRGDAQADLKVDAPLGEVLTAVSATMVP